MHIDPIQTKLILQVKMLMMLINNASREKY